MRKYQAIFILAPPADETALETHLEAIRAEITKLGGTLEASTKMGRHSFARPLKKKESGFYMLFTFSIEPTQLIALRERWGHNPDVLRVQIVLAVTPPVEPAQPASTPAAAANKGA